MEEILKNKVLKNKEQIEAQLAQSQKMETIGILASGIAHDFKNILTIIIGFTELALEDYTNLPKVKRHMEEVLEASYRARDLAQQILSFSKNGEKEKRIVKINSIVNDVLNMISLSLPQSIEIRQDISDSEYEICADPTQLYQVLMNLCTNAYHAMKEQGGVLEVTLTDLNRDLSSISEENPAPSTYLRLTVSDSGHGMTTEVMKRIFEPFFTTKKENEGTGLGLSIVQSIVRSLDGEITVESKPGKGSSFHVFLPVFRNTTPIKEKTHPTATATHGKEHILLVDDEAAIVNMNRKMLEKLGYVVTPCTAGLEALHIFGENPAAFDLLITDLSLPDMNGKQLIRELSRKKPGIPIILCTGYTQDICREDFEDLKIDALILKPYKKEEIISTIRKVLDSTSLISLP